MILNNLSSRWSVKINNTNLKQNKMQKQQHNRYLKINHTPTLNAAFSLVFNISFELCFLGLAKFPLETPFVLDTFWRFYFKGDGGELEPKQAMCEHRKRRSKGEKYNLGEV
jgi:hypothetical protein